MIVSFETRQLKEICLVLHAAEQQLGLHAQALVTMIADIEAFEEAEQMMVFVDGGGMIECGDSLVLPIGATFRARFVAAGRRFRRDTGGRVIWSSVTRLKLIEIEGCR